VIVLLAAAALGFAAPAPAKVDHDAGVRFDLQGTVLTVVLVRPDLGEEVWGKPTTAVCSPVFSSRSSRLAVHTTQPWPEGATELSYTFERDVSKHVKWCLLEDDSGGDLASVQFEPFIRVFGDTPKQRRTGRRLRHDLLRAAGDAAWVWKIGGIVVQPGTIAVTTDLRRNRRGKRVAREICRSTDHTDLGDAALLVFARGEVVLRRCRSG